MPFWEPMGPARPLWPILSLGLGGYQPQRGQIYFEGKDITGKSVTERARLGITLAWQDPTSFEGLTIQEYLELAQRHGHGPAQELVECLKLVGLQPARYLSRPLNEHLSGGERKRIELAAVLAMAPKLAILDEPDSGIDALSLQDIMDVIHRMNQAGTAVLLITHREEFALSAHRASHLCGGTILKTGTPGEVVAFYKQHCKRCDHVNKPKLKQLEEFNR